MTEEQYKTLYSALVAIFITNLYNLFLLFVIAWHYLIHGLLRDLRLKTIAP